MKIINVQRFCEVYGEIQDLIEAGYCLTFYDGETRLQGKFIGALVKKYLEPAHLHIDPGTGYVEGLITAGDLPIILTMTE
jgi:hypothetical protein